MYNKTINRIKPPTKQMIEFLMECHERELMNLNPCEATERGARGLIGRQLLRTQYFVDEKGKRYLSVIVTDVGRNFLREVCD